MTGKETLDDYKDFGKIKGESTTSNQTFVPSPFHYEWRQKYFEEIEDVNLRVDMVCARNDELENKLSKYERAFEILKDRLTFVVYESPNIPSTYFLLAEREKIEEEEVELLKELMKDAKD